MTRVQLFMKTKDRQGVNHMLIFDRPEPREKLTQYFNETPADALVPIELAQEKANVTVRWGEVAWWLLTDLEDVPQDAKLIEDEGGDKKPNVRPLPLDGSANSEKEPKEEGEA